MSRHGYIYLIRDDNTGLIKIGFSVKPRQRIKGLKRSAILPRGSMATFTLDHAFMGTLQEEKRLHTVLERFRVRGEWFALCQCRCFDVLVAFGNRARLEGVEWCRLEDEGDPFDLLTDMETPCPCNKTLPESPTFSRRHA